MQHNITSSQRFSLILSFRCGRVLLFLLTTSFTHYKKLCNIIYNKSEIITVFDNFFLGEITKRKKLITIKKKITTSFLVGHSKNHIMDFIHIIYLKTRIGKM